MRPQPQSRSSGAAGKGGKLAGRIRYASYLDAKPRERGILPPAVSGVGGAAEANPLAERAERERQQSRHSLGPAGADAGEGRE
jgi:hypothetical protein